MSCRVMSRHFGLGRSGLVDHQHPTSGPAKVCGDHVPMDHIVFLRGFRASAGSVGGTALVQTASASVQK